MLTLASLTWACSNGELHKGTYDGSKDEKSQSIKAETNTMRQDHEIAGSQQGSSPKRKDRSSPDDDSTSDVALPPNNLAGAYLVEPKPTSCLWEKKASNSTVISLCGLSLQTTRKPDLDSTASDTQFQLTDDQLSKEVAPIIVENRVAGLLVHAKNPEQAAERAQENFIASKLLVDAGRTAVESESRMTFKYAPGKYIVYARSELKPQDDKPSAVAMALEFKKIIFSKNLPTISFSSWSSLLDSLIANLLLKAGLLVAEPAPSLGLVEGEKLETGLMTATSLAKSNIEGDLKGNNTNFDQLFPPQ